jgi:hypothetical protein
MYRYYSRKKELKQDRERERENKREKERERVRERERKNKELPFFVGDIPILFVHSNTCLLLGQGTWSLN